MPTLYVTEPDARIEKEYRRLLVSTPDKVLLALPIARLDHIVLIGCAGVTTPALHALLEAEIGLTLLSRSGRLLGRLCPATAPNIALRHQQYARAQSDNFCVELARAVVSGKLRNSRSLARRWLRTVPDAEHQPTLARLDRAVTALAGAESLARLRGLEGSGTRAYFALWRQALDPPFTFNKRTRRPPRDPVNAMLSFGYTLLTDNLMTACEIVGLDPYDGFLHADKYGRPALALDLMEEFRALIVDAVVLTLVNRERLTPDDFEPSDDGGIQMSRAALQIFLTTYQKRIQTEVYYPLAKRRLSYQKIFEMQARLLRHVIEGRVDAYSPFRTR